MADEKYIITVTKEITPGCIARGIETEPPLDAWPPDVKRYVVDHLLSDSMGDAMDDYCPSCGMLIDAGHRCPGEE